MFTEVAAATSPLFPWQIWTAQAIPASTLVSCAEAAKWAKVGALKGWRGGAIEFNSGLRAK